MSDNEQPWEDLTCDEMVEYWLELKKVANRAQDQAAEVEQAIVELAESQSWLIDNVGFVEIRPGSRRTTWDTELLWSAAVERGRTHRALNADTGDVESEAEAVGKTLRSLFGKSPNFTRGGVTGVGLEPNRFCETSEPGRSTISVKGGAA